MKKTYYYYDNWSGAKHQDTNIKKLKARAKKETGQVITIRNNVNQDSITITATGYCPA